MKLFIGNGSAGMHLYPNPAAPGNLNLQMVNQQPGMYMVKLINTFGQVFMTRSVYTAGGISLENLKPGLNIPKGLYQLEITSPQGKKNIISVIF